MHENYPFLTKPSARLLPPRFHSFLTITAEKYICEIKFFTSSTAPPFSSAKNKKNGKYLSDLDKKKCVSIFLKRNIIFIASNSSLK